MRPENKDLNFIRTLNDKLNRKDSILDLAYERMGDAGIVFLCRNKDLSHVQKLDLSWNEITDEGLGVLAGSGSLAGLKHLILNANQIGDEGAVNLAVSKNLPNLESVELVNNQAVSYTHLRAHET